MKAWMKASALSVIAGIVVVSFFLHTVEWKHDHPHHDDSHHEEGAGEVSELSVYLHAGERKVFTLTESGQDSIALLDIFRSKDIAQSTHREDVGVRGERHGDHLKESLRKGILNPKIFENQQSS